MKQIRFLLIALCVISMTSCTKDEPQTNFEDSKDNQFKTELAELIIEQAKTESESYFWYEAETQTWTTISPEEHQFFCALSEFLSGKNSADEIISKVQIKASNSNGWVLIGKGKSNADAWKIASKAMQDISQARDFEIRVVHNADGTYNVYWRYI